MKKLLCALIALSLVLGGMALAEAERSYEGHWVCERAAIDIAETGDAYEVNVVWGNSAFDQTEWHYACQYDIDRNLLYSVEPGTKEIVGCDENGARTVLSTEYEDGAATFAIDGAGMLIWDDAKEHAAEGMRFERGADPDAIAAAQKVIAPMDVDVDLDDGTYPVRFDSADVKDGGIADVGIYTVDCYDIVDVAQMAVGDAFNVEGVTVEITSLEEGDDGSKIINGGLDGDGYVLRPFEEDNCYKVVETDDFNTYTQRSVQTLPFAEDVTFTDGWDIGKAPVTVSGIEAVTAAITGSGDDSFDPYSTQMCFVDGKIAEINREYVP